MKPRNAKLTHFARTNRGYSYSGGYLVWLAQITAETFGRLRRRT